MSARKVRVERLIRIREDRLHEEVKKLKQADAHMLNATRDDERARATLAQAEQRRRDLGQAPSNVLDFIEAEEWLWTREQAQVETGRRLRLAAIEQRKAQLRVKLARDKLRQLERLKERIVEREREAAARAGRLQDDELAQRVSRAARERS